MFRLTAVWGIVLAGLMTVAAGAGQPSSSFRVGLTIGGYKAKPGRVQIRPVKSYTWRAAAISVRASGYRKPVKLRSASGLYWFEAERNGRRHHVAVSVTTGRIVATANP